MIYFGTLWPNKMGYWKKQLVVVTRDGNLHKYCLNSHQWMPKLSPSPPVIAEPIK